MTIRDIVYKKNNGDFIVLKNQTSPVDIPGDPGDIYEVWVSNVKQNASLGQLPETPIIKSFIGAEKTTRIIDGKSYDIYKFIVNGKIEFSYGGQLDYLMIAGGGGGGCFYAGAGGGGAGGYLSGTVEVLSDKEYSINVGKGGRGARGGAVQNNGTTNGTNTSAFGLTAIGGGFGGSGTDGQDGGSGGGGSFNNGSGGAGAPGQGNGGGDGEDLDNPANRSGGGGGGAGGPGDPGLGDGEGALGGPGVLNDITGDSVYYATGGSSVGSGAEAGIVNPRPGGMPSLKSRQGNTDRIGSGVYNGAGGSAGLDSSGRNVAWDGADGVLYIRVRTPESQNIVENPATVGSSSVSPNRIVDANNGKTYDVYEFTSNGSIELTSAGLVEYLVVAGGGGGGIGAYNRGCGGGGGGGVRTGSLSVLANTYNVTVGVGGLGGINHDQQIDTNLVNRSPMSGGYSEVFGIVSYGGGYGSSDYIYGGSGGSGGGAAQSGSSTSPGYSAFGQGNPGGNSHSDSNNAGGGGGAGSTGSDGSSNSGGDGGIGVFSSIDGVGKLYGGGGGGSSYNFSIRGGSGNGGGGDAFNADLSQTPAKNGVDGTGGGGGGSGYGRNDPSYVSGNGGSGIVIIRVEVQ